MISVKCELDANGQWHIEVSDALTASQSNRLKRTLRVAIKRKRRDVRLRSVTKRSKPESKKTDKVKFSLKDSSNA